MSEPTSEELLEQMGYLLNQGKLDEASELAPTLKKRILELLRQGNTEEADKLLPPIMLLPPDRAFLTEYGTLTAAQMPKEEPKKWWQFWK